MIIEQRPNPRLTWPARLCLLALAGVVLPASIVAVAEDEPAEDQKPAANTDAEPSEGTTDQAAAEVGNTSTIRSPRVKQFALQNADARETTEMLKQLFGNTGSQGEFSLTVRGNSILVSGTDEQLNDVEQILARLVGPGSEGQSEDDKTEVTITVVRAQYFLLEKVAKAFDKFIQQHGERFEFLMSKAIAPLPDSGMSSMGMMGDFSRFGGKLSQLTIIATPEVQQRFGDFIKVLSAVQIPEFGAAGDGATETLTLTRVHYKLPHTAAGAAMMMGMGGAGMGAMTVMAGAPRPSHSGSVFDLLTAVKESNLVPLLLVSADGDRLTVTTTEDFQQQLGKFIRFLQEHEPQDVEEGFEDGDFRDANREILEGYRDVVEQSGAPKRPRESKRATAVRIAEHQKEQRAAALLKKAREFLAQGQLGRARAMVAEASKLDVDYHLFDDLPVHVLADIERAEAAAGDESAAVDSRTGRLMFGARSPATSTRSRLSELRHQERELSALLDVIADSLQEEANRTPLLLAISRFYGDNAAGTSLIEMFNKLVELETKKGDFVPSYGPQHPKVIDLQAKIDTQRRSFGLPTGADAKPVDLLDVYIQALKRQLDVTRKIINALGQDEIPDAFRAPQSQKRSN